MSLFDSRPVFQLPRAPEATASRQGERLASHLAATRTPIGRNAAQPVEDPRRRPGRHLARHHADVAVVAGRAGRALRVTRAVHIVVTDEVIPRAEEIVTAVDFARTAAPAKARASRARQARCDREATPVDALVPIRAGAVRRVALAKVARPVHTRRAGRTTPIVAWDAAYPGAAEPPHRAGVAAGGTVRRVGLEVGTHMVAAGLPAGAGAAVECAATAIVDHAALAGLTNGLRRAAIALVADLDPD
jgi:hypothetical protein